MSHQDKNEFLLSFDYIEVGVWEPKVNTRPRRVSTISYYPALKPAFEALMQLDKRQFNEELAIKFQLPQIISNACILDDQSKILLLSRYIEHYQLSDLKDGVYIELNSKYLPKQQFEKETGYDLGTIALKGPQFDYYLLPGTSIGNVVKLEAEQRRLLTQMRKGPKLRRDDNSSGLKI
jgi:hypothetical protein